MGNFSAYMEGYLRSREKLRYDEYLRQMNQMDPLKKAEVEANLLRRESEMVEELGKIQRQRARDAGSAYRIRLKGVEELRGIIARGEYKLAAARIAADTALFGYVSGYAVSMAKATQVPQEDIDELTKKIRGYSKDIARLSGPIAGGAPTGEQKNEINSIFTKLNVAVEDADLDPGQKAALRLLAEDQIYNSLRGAGKPHNTADAMRVRLRVMHGKLVQRPYDTRSIEDLKVERDAAASYHGANIGDLDGGRDVDVSVSYRGTAPVEGAQPQPVQARGQATTATPSAAQARSIEATLPADATREDIIELAKHPSLSPAEAAIYNQIAQLRGARERLNKQAERAPQAWDAQLRSFFGSPENQAVATALNELYASGDEARIESFEQALSQIAPEPFERSQRRRGRVEQRLSRQADRVAEGKPIWRRRGDYARGERFPELGLMEASWALDDLPEDETWVDEAPVAEPVAAEPVAAEPPAQPTGTDGWANYTILPDGNIQYIEIADPKAKVRILEKDGYNWEKVREKVVFSAPEGAPKDYAGQEWAAVPEPVPAPVPEPVPAPVPEAVPVPEAAPPVPEAAAVPDDELSASGPDPFANVAAHWAKQLATAAGMARGSAEQKAALEEVLIAYQILATHAGEQGSARLEEFRETSEMISASLGEQEWKGPAPAPTDAPSALEAMGGADLGSSVWDEIENQAADSGVSGATYGRKPENARVWIQRTEYFEDEGGEPLTAPDVSFHFTMDGSEHSERLAAKAKERGSKGSLHTIDEAKKYLPVLQSAAANNQLGLANTDLFAADDPDAIFREAMAAAYPDDESAAESATDRAKAAIENSATP